MQARLHEHEMYLVTVRHSAKTTNLLLTEDLEMALSTARGAEEFGFLLKADKDSDISIHAMHVGVADAKREPIFQRFWGYDKDFMNREWLERWHSNLHKLLAERLKKSAARRRRTHSRR